MAQRDYELPAESLDPAETFVTLASTPGTERLRDVAPSRTLKEAMNCVASEPRTRPRQNIRELGAASRAAGDAGTPR